MKKLVYVIEDDVDILTMMATMLLNNGYEIHADWNGNDFDSATINAPLPDLYIMDINLFGKSGLDLCKKVKEQTPAIPVLIISANPNITEKALAAGADVFIEKPFSIKHLVEQIRTLTSQAIPK